MPAKRHAAARIRRAADLSAGIRAGAFLRIAFPWRNPQWPLMQLHALTVAGAAQVAESASSAAQGSCFPFNPTGLERRAGTDLAARL